MKESNFIKKEIENNEKIFKNPQDFRNRATDNDYIEMENYINSLQKKSTEFKCEQYNFSYSAAMGLLKEHAMNSECSKEDFVILNMPKGEYVSRTFTVKKSVMERLDKFCDMYEQYNKQAIISVLLDEVLSKYE